MTTTKRLKSVLATIVVAPTLAATVLVGGATPAHAATLDYTTPGEYVFNVPAGVTSIHVHAVGGSGGQVVAGRAGPGAVVTGDIAVSPGQRLFLEVGGNGTGRFDGVIDGQGGFNGGGAGGHGSAGGGGASDVRTCGRSDTTCNTLASRLLIAGGGGGTGNGGSTTAGPGGVAGGPPAAAHDGPTGTVGRPGGCGCVAGFPGGAGGGGGTLTAGGAGGAADTGGFGGSGSLGSGGNAQPDTFGNLGGGGGGGYYGGGAGGLSDNNGTGGGGGAGSTFATAQVTSVVIGTDGIRTPAIHISFTDPPVDQPPVAADDAYTVNQNTPLSIPAPGVLANDRDPEGAPLTAHLVAPGPRVTLQNDGSFTYDGTGAPSFVGAISFSYRAQAGDKSSDIATVTITVVAVDSTPPTLHLPEPITVNASGATGGAPVTFTATADDGNPAHPAVTCSPASGSTFPIGVTTVACSATDSSGNTRNGSFAITVRDILAPVVSVPAPITADADAGGHAAVTFTATATDDDARNPHPAVRCSPASGSTFTVGLTTVGCSATDAAGNTGSASFTVTVRDVTPPALNLPAPITVDASAATGGAAVSYAASATDLNPANPAVTCTPASGSTFAIGVTTVNCSAADTAGNAASGSFTVTVRDVLPPVVSAPAPITVNAAGTTGGAAVTFSASAADDDRRAPNPAVTCAPASGSTFAIGVTTVSCSATDLSGNTGSATFTVTVKDILPPVVSAPAPITVNATGTTGGAAVTFSASATDDDRRSPNPAVTCTPASGSTFAIGVTTVSCTATDLSGNTGSATFTVTVKDILPPVLSLPAPLAVNATGTTGGATVTFTATASDDDRRSPNPAVTCTPASGSTFAIGVNKVDCASIDLSGNSATGSFTVEVKDILPPVLTVPGPMAVNATSPSGATATFTATATDDDRRILHPAVTCTPASSSTFAIGDTTVTCTATDLYGNVGSASFNVHVKGAAEQLADAVANFKGVGPGASVSSKIERAQADFAAGNVAKACKSLDDAIHQLDVHSPNQIDAALAVRLTADAQRIQAVMAC